MSVLSHQEVGSSFPLELMMFHPSALQSARSSTGQYQGLQAVQESGRPPSLHESRTYRQVWGHEIGLYSSWYSRWSFRGV